ncbi:MAG: glycosyltransferase family 9 protein, partial [Planctomycetota bacterium]
YPHEHLVAVARQLIERTGRPVVIGWGAPAEGDIARGLVEHINAAPGLRAASAVPADASSAPADALAAPAVALAASADALAAPAAGSAASPTARAVLAPPTTLSEQAALLDRVLVAVGPDTGPIHIAVARGVPCVTVYGASDPLRNGPYGPAHAALTVDLPCRPCWKQRCPLTDTPLICLKKIPPERVVAAVLERAARAAPGSTPAPVQPGAAALVQSDAPVPVQPGAPVPVQLDAPTAPPGEA